jgi:leader peptidase (prepilin peptidase)/N-methyltransferase
VVFPSLALPALQAADPPVRQHSAAQLSAPARALPELQRGDLLALSVWSRVLAGLAAVAAVGALGLSAHALLAFAFLCALIVITFIDYDPQIISRRDQFAGIGVGFAAALVLGSPSWAASLAGILLGGGGLLWGVCGGLSLAHPAARAWAGRHQTVLAMIGAFLGWQAVPVTLMIASLAGTMVGVALMLLQRHDRRAAIPFGPFLAVGATARSFWGDALITWYLGFAQGA